MKIQFLADTTVEIIESFDEAEDQITSSYERTFRAGESADVDHCENNQVQFGDGSIAFIDPSAYIDSEAMKRVASDSVQSVCDLNKRY